MVLLVFLHLGGQPLVIDLLQQIEQGGNGLDDSHLENPPDNDLDGQEHISAEGGHGGAGQDRQGKPHIEAVVFRQLGTEMQGPVQLPKREAQQDGRENQVGQVVRDKDDSERDDQQSHQHNGRVRREGGVDLPAVQADEQRAEDGCQQPGIFYQQPRCHREEVMLGDGSPDGDGKGKNDHGNQQQQAELVFLELFGPEVGDKAHEQAGQQAAQQDGDDQVEQHEESKADDHGTAPFTLDGIKKIAAVFFAGVQLGAPEEETEAAKDAPVGGLTVDEDVVLHLAITLLGVIVGFLQHGIHP